MTKDEARTIQMQIADSMLKRFYGTPYDINSKEDELFIKNCMRKIARCEFEVLKSNYPNVRMDFDAYLDLNSDTNGYFSINMEDSEGRIKIDNNVIPQIRINMGQFLRENNGFRMSSDNVGERVSSCLAIFDTIYHEFNHYEQHLKLISNNRKNFSLDIFNIAKEQVLQNKYYQDIYKNNYGSYSFEVDSRVVASEKVSELINKFSDVKKLSRLNRAKRKYDIDRDRLLKTVNYRKFGKNGLIQDSEVFNSQILDDTIKNEPTILEAFPILRLKYDSDGKKKDIEHLVDNLRAFIDGNKDRSDQTRNETIKIMKECIIESLETSSEEEIKKLQQKYGPNFFRAMNDFNKSEQLKKVQDIDKAKAMAEEKSMTKGAENLDILKQITLKKHERRSEMLQTYEKGISQHRDKNIVINGVDIGYSKKVLYGDKEENNKKIFINQMLDFYSKYEDKNKFDRRKLLESKYINLVVNSTNLNRCHKSFIDFISHDNKNVSFENRMSAICYALKTAQNMTIPGGKDYLSDLCSIPEFDRALKRMRASPEFQALNQKYKNKSPQGYMTDLDKDNEMATKYLDGKNDVNLRIHDLKNQNKIDNYMSENRKAAWRIVSYGHGYEVTKDPNDPKKMIRSNEKRRLITKSYLEKYCTNPERITDVISEKKKQSLKREQADISDVGER